MKKRPPDVLDFCSSFDWMGVGQWKLEASCMVLWAGPRVLFGVLLWNRSHHFLGGSLDRRAVVLTESQHRVLQSANEGVCWRFKGGRTQGGRLFYLTRGGRAQWVTVREMVRKGFLKLKPDIDEVYEITSAGQKELKNYRRGQS